MHRASSKLAFSMHFFISGSLTKFCKINPRRKKIIRNIKQRVEEKNERIKLIEGKREREREMKNEKQRQRMNKVVLDGDC